MTDTQSKSEKFNTQVNQWDYRKKNMNNLYHGPEYLT